MKKTIAILTALFAMSAFGASAIADDWNQNRTGEDRYQPEGKPAKKKRKGKKDGKHKKTGKKKYKARGEAI